MAAVSKAQQRIERIRERKRKEREAEEREEGRVQALEQLVPQRIEAKTKEQKQAVDKAACEAESRYAEILGEYKKRCGISKLYYTPKQLQKDRDRENTEYRRELVKKQLKEYGNNYGSYLRDMQGAEEDKDAFAEIVAIVEEIQREDISKRKSASKPKTQENKVGDDGLTKQQRHEPKRLSRYKEYSALVKERSDKGTSDTRKKAIDRIIDAEYPKEKVRHARRMETQRIRRAK